MRGRGQDYLPVINYPLNKKTTNLAEIQNFVANNSLGSAFLGFTQTRHFR